MSAIDKIRREIQETRKTNNNGGVYSAYRDYRPQYFASHIGQKRGRKEEEEIRILLPKKPKNREPLQDVGEEAEKSHHRREKQDKQKKRKNKDATNNGESDDSDDDEDEKKKGGKRKKKKEVFWGPTEILDHLDDPSVVLDLDGKILPSLLVSMDDKGKPIEDEIIVWDHGATPKGENSDSNFFQWLEAYSNLRCEEKKQQENAAFN